MSPLLESISGVRLVCVDIDGTLVGSSGNVHDAVWSAAHDLRASGVRIAICSGRPALGVAVEYARRLDADGWHSFQNGASVVHLADGQSRSVALPPGVVPTLVEMARRSGRMLELYSDSAYAIESTGGVARAHAALLGVPFAPRAFESLEGPIVRAQWMVPFSETQAVLAESYPGLEVAPSTSPVMPDVQFISLTHAGIDKAHAVRTMATAYGIALDDVMFVGDSANDFSAMSIVGTPVAMANAESHIIDIATFTVGHVDAGALADALRAATPRVRR